MYKIKNTSISMTRGDTLIVQVKVMKNGEEYICEEGDAIRFALRKPEKTADGSAWVDANALFTKDINVSDPNNLLLQLNPNDTKSLPFGSYVYDIQITFANGNVDTFIPESSFTLLPEVD